MNESGISNEGRLPMMEERKEFRENDRIVELLRNVETSYGNYHLIAGGTGVAGVLGRETRVIRDLDILVPTVDIGGMVELLGSDGFFPWDKEKTAARLLGNPGCVLERAQDGLLVDLVGVTVTENGLQNPIGAGSIFIPNEGINYPVSLRDIPFLTFSPEVHYFFKNRATRRVPWQTIWWSNRPKDENDLRYLTEIIDQDKAKHLLSMGFQYKGPHPLPARLLQEARNRLGMK